MEQKFRGLKKKKRKRKKEGGDPSKGRSGGKRSSDSFAKDFVARGENG